MEAESRSMKMLLQRLPIKGFLLVFATWTILFFICVIIGATGPRVYDYQDLPGGAWMCPDASMRQYDPAVCDGVDLTQPGTVITLEVSADRLNQGVYLESTLTNRLFDSVTIEKKVAIKCDVYARQNDDEAWTPLLVGSTKERAVYCPQGKWECYPLTIANIQYIDYRFYQFQISIDTKATSVEFIGNVFFKFTMTHNNFTLFELWFRFAFLILSFVALMIFVIKLRKFAWAYWTFEQKWTLVLLFGLLFYNNPFYPLEILLSGWFPVFLNRVLYGSFLMLLMLYWLVTLDGIRTEPQKITFTGFYLPKLILMVTSWICIITVFVWANLYAKDDPSYNAVDEIPGFIFFEVVLLILLVIYIFWIVYIVCRGCGDIKVIPALGPRLKFFAVFTLIVLAIAIGGVIFGFLDPSRNNAAQFLTYTGLFNLYMFVNAFLYLPAGVSSDPTYTQNFPQPEQTEVVRLEEDEAQ